MKIKHLIVASLLALVSIIITPLRAAPTDMTVWAGGGATNTTSWAAVPHTSRGSTGNTAVSPVLTYLNATSDAAAGKVQFYNAGRPAVCAYTNLGTTIYLNITNAMTLATGGFNTNAGVILIYHKASGLFDRRVLGGSPSGTNLVTTVATTNLVGDIIWPMTPAGYIPVGAATKEIVGTGIYSGEPGEPLLMDITGTSNSCINAASARFAP
jgi:hypothetical protein